MENGNIIQRLERAGVKLLEGPPGEIRVDLKSQRLTEMMGYPTARQISPDGGLSNFCVVKLPGGDPSVRARPTDGVEYGRSPITR